jgi:hypothetical protein
MNIVFGGSIVGVAYITEFYCLVLRSRIWAIRFLNRATGPLVGLLVYDDL